MTVVPGGPYDQRPVLDRPDVLVYTTPPLDKDVEVTGPIDSRALRRVLRDRHRLHGEAG